MAKVLINLRVEAETKARYEAAAAAFGLSLSQWMRQALDAVSEPKSFEYRPPTQEEVDALQRLRDEGTKIPHAVALPDRSFAPAQPLKEPGLRKDLGGLCPRCARIGAPSCLECRKAAGLGS